MRPVLAFLAAVALAIGLFVAAAPHASASALNIRVDISSQRLYVYEGRKRIHAWPISSGRRGYRTPYGSYRPYWLSRHHRSRKYNNAPMPHAIFFRGGYAIHGTYATRRLGRPASHGCIRLAPRAAARLFSLVKRYGKRRTSIRITR